MDDEQFNSLRTQMDSIPKPRTGSQAPSMQEINAQQRGMETSSAIRSMVSKDRAENWYPEEENEQTGGQSVPLLNKLIDTSLAPLYGIVGAIDYAKGDAEGRSLGQSIDYNANTAKRTFTDVTGSKVGGLALDIMFDPLNWATAGTAALVPRVAAGAYKGAAKSGVKGAAKGIASGAESRILESALTMSSLGSSAIKGAGSLAGRANPFRLAPKLTTKITGKAAPEVAETATEVAAKQTAFKDWWDNRSYNAANAYDEIMGTSALERVIKDAAPVGMAWRLGMGEIADRVATKAPKFTDHLNKYWNYSNKDWTKIARLKDTMMDVAGDDWEAASLAYIRAKKNGEEFTETFNKIKAQKLEQARKNTPAPGQADDLMAVAEGKPRLALDEQQKNISMVRAAQGEEKAKQMQLFHEANNDAADIAANPQAYVTLDTIENHQRMKQSASEFAEQGQSGVLDALQEMMANKGSSESGIEWYDKSREAVKNFKRTLKRTGRTGKNIPVQVGAAASDFLDSYEFMLSLFKRGVVGASPSAWTNAIFGNLFMGKMAGLDVTDKLYYQSMKESNSMIGNKSNAELLLKELYGLEDMLATLRNNPTLFETVSGKNVRNMERIVEAKLVVDNIKKKAIDGGVLPKSTTDAQAIDHISEMMDEAAKAELILDRLVAKNRKGASARMISEADAEGNVSKSTATDMVSQEFFDSPGATAWIKKHTDLADANPNNFTSKLIKTLFNTLPDEYGKLDYRYKLGTTIYATKYGLKESELRVVTRNIGLSMDDVTERVQKDGVVRFRIHPAKAMELANEAYLNYAAMPAVVKMLRQLPFVGAPFASFMYGMYTKTGRTALSNPSVFNKVALGLNATPEETPIEKAMLTNNRYSYLDDDAMVKVPFFGNNMVFLNLANMIPYYTMNMFQPPQRKYEGILPNAVIQTLDKTPILQDPVGSVMFDYFLLPHLIGDEVPKGTFGQTLYPADATRLEKIGYAARSLSDPMIPSITQPVLGTAAGLAENMGMLPEGATQFMPGYRTRSLGEAVQGNTSVGVSSRENPTQRYARGLGAVLGFPVQSPVPFNRLDEDAFKANNANNNE
jgi:hypothetical protein